MVKAMTIPMHLPIIKLRCIVAVLASAFVAMAGGEPVSAAGPKPVAGSLTGGAGDLVPHRAAYRMTLKSAKSESGIIDARGATLYRFVETCDAWAMENNIHLNIRYAGDLEARITWSSFAAVESKDGKTYSFRLRHKRGKETVEQLQGSATLTRPGGSGTARFTGAGKGTPDKNDAGEDVTIDLPKGTFFPTHHLLALLKAGREGTRFMPGVVFDGASLENPYNVTATIAGAETANIGKPVKALAQAAGLADLPARGMLLAFFPVRSREPEPDFEVGVDYRADGLATRVTHDYGEFSINMVPNEIEVLPRPDC